MRHTQESLQAARYIVARYIRAGLEGAGLKRRVERHAGMLRGTEPALADALEQVGLRAVRGLVESTLQERRHHEWIHQPRSTKGHRAAVVAAICSGEES